MSQPGTNRRFLAEERRQRVAALYLRRTPQGQICKILNLAPYVVCRDVKILMQRWQKEQLDDTDKAMRRDLADLEEMELECSQHLNAPGIKQGDAARWFENRLRCKERRAKLLGLDAPLNANVNLVTENPFDGKAIGEIATIARLADHFTEGDLAFLEQVASRLAAPGEDDGPGGNGDDPAKD